MSDTVVVAVDGSAHTDKVLDAAAAYARQTELPVVVVHVRELEGVGKAGAVWREEREETAEIAARAVEHVKAQGAVADAVTASAGIGHVARAIADIARDRQARIVVVGTRGHGQIAGLLLGSTATKLLHLMDRPILVVP
ncbi:MAG TPA: universal stress protein [Acidimicrobiales bacterium]|jgi:nucleotide-binding universal stress UspA family protein|nr:universal stress protein [Acidimicrobiales bacterium]